MTLTTFIRSAGAVCALALAIPAAADIPVYPNQGTENPEIYSFTAAADGDLVAYFTGSTGSFTNVLGLILNGTDLGLSTLDSQVSAPGDSFNFGAVSAGDTLVFYIDVNGGEFRWHSTPALNSDLANHVWSTDYAGGDFGIPAGRFVTFEDLPADGTDFNYEDLGFVFTNVDAVVTPVPEPAAWALMVAGFGVVGAAMRRRTTVRVTLA